MVFDLCLSVSIRGSAAWTVSAGAVADGEESFEVGGGFFPCDGGDFDGAEAGVFQVGVEGDFGEA